MQPDLNVAPQTPSLSRDERRVCDEIARREDDLVELLRSLVRLDTTTHALGAPPRQERELQELLAHRLLLLGA